MKLLKVLFSGTLLLVLATSCRKEAAQPPASLLEKSVLSTAGRGDNPSTFPDMDAFLDYFDQIHYEGFEASIIIRDGQIVITGTTETGNPPSTPMAAKHDKETKDKIAFARWCNEQLNKGKILTIGKDKDGTYWADIK